MVPPDEDIGKALVIAQNDVEARFQLFDEIGFEQQSLGLGLRDDKLHGRRQRDHQRDPLCMPAELGVIPDPVFQILRLADIQDFAVRTEHAVHARLAGQAGQIVLDDGNALRCCGHGIIVSHSGKMSSLGERSSERVSGSCPLRQLC